MPPETCVVSRKLGQSQETSLVLPLRTVPSGLEAGDLEGGIAPRSRGRRDEDGTLIGQVQVVLTRWARKLYE